MAGVPRASRNFESSGRRHEAPARTAGTEENSATTAGLYEVKPKRAGDGTYAFAIRTSARDRIASRAVRYPTKIDGVRKASNYIASHQRAFTMYGTILIPTDGSDGTRQAAAHGLGLAETYGATVHVLYVADTGAIDYDNEGFDDSDVIEMLTRRGQRVTDAITQRAEARGLETEGAVVQGIPDRAILRYASEHDVDLIAMGTRGRSGLARYLLGSVAESVFRNAERPVLTARGAVAARTTEYDHILFPTDGGTHAERVAEHAFDIASHYGATVHALSVIDTGSLRSSTLLAPLEAESERALEAAERHGQQQDVEVVTDVWRGTPSDCITTYATEADIDLITIGTHERRGLDRFLTQSIANRVVRTANCPVVTLSKPRE